MSKKPSRTPAGATAPAPRTITPELIAEALSFIPPDVDRDTWVRVAMAIKSELFDAVAFDLWNEWSARGETYGAAAARDTWRSVKAGGRTTIGTLFGIAKDHGFRFPQADAAAPVQTPEQAAAARAEAERLAEAKRRRHETEAAGYRQRAERAARDAAELWAGASAEAAAAPYLVRKGVQAHGVRLLPDGTLLVPMHDEAGELHTVQRIAPARPADGSSDKRFLPGGRKKGLFHLIGHTEGAAALLLAEGYATCATLHEATGHPVAVCFDAGNLATVAAALRARHPGLLLLVCADDDRETAARTGRNTGVLAAAAAARAAAAGGADGADGAGGALAGVVVPEGLPAGGTDFNDLAAHAGLAAVRELVARAVAAPSIPKPQRGVRAAAGARAGAGQGGSGPEVETAAPAPDAAASRGGAAVPPGDAGSAGGDDDGGEDDPFHLVPEGVEVSPVDDRCNRPGVWFYGRAADNERKRPVWVCAPLRVTANTSDEADNGHGYLIEFQNRAGNARAWAAPAALFGGDSAAWAERLRDMGLRMAPGTRARNLVGQYIDTRRPREWVTSTDRVGWHGGVYVMPSRCMGGAADDGAGRPARRYVFQSDGALDDTFRRRGELATWQREVAARCAGNTRLVFVLACAFAGPLVGPLAVQTGGFHLVGDTSLGKTTALLVAASVWGPPKFKQQWRSTDNGLESVAVQHSDCLLILDEIGQMDGRTVGDAVYMLANEAEKIRNTRALMVRKRRTWRLIFLSSGEKSLADHMQEAGRRPNEGQMVRLPSIPGDAGAGLGMFECLHDVAVGEGASKTFAETITAASAASYGSAGAAWLEWLAAHMAELPARGAELMHRMECEWVPQGANAQVWRVAKRFALVGAAGELATEAGITGWAAGEAERGARACFDAWLNERGHTGNGVHIAMLQQVRAFLEKNGAALFTWANRAMDDHTPSTPLRAGFKRYVDDNGQPLKIDASMDYMERRSTADSSERMHAQIEYLVLPEAFKRDVCKGFPPVAVAEVLRERGHLVHERDRLTDKQRLPGMGGGKPVPCYHIRPSIFADEL